MYMNKKLKREHPIITTRMLPLLCAFRANHNLVAGYGYMYLLAIFYISRLLNYHYLPLHISIDLLKFQFSINSIVYY